MYLVRDYHHDENISQFAKEAYNLHYHAYNKKQIEDFIIDVIHGVDRKKNEKEIFYKKNLCPVGERTACDNIINAILNS